MAEELRGGGKKSAKMSDGAIAKIRRNGAAPSMSRGEKAEKANVKRAAKRAPRARTSFSTTKRDAEAKRTWLLDCAEELFAQWGYAGVSVRDVTDLARMRLASITYYFGSKENLYFEVLLRRSEPLCNARLERLNAVLESNLHGRRKLAALVDAYVDPPLEFSLNGGAGWKRYFKLIGHITFSSLWPKELAPYYNEPARKLIEGLGQLYPQTSKAQLQAAALLMLGPYIFVLAETGRIETFAEGQYSSSDIAFQIPMLKEMLIGGVHSALTRGVQVK